MRKERKKRFLTRRNLHRHPGGLGNVGFTLTKKILRSTYRLKPLLNMRLGLFLLHLLLPLPCCWLLFFFRPSWWNSATLRCKSRESPPNPSCNQSRQRNRRQWKSACSTSSSIPGHSGHSALWYTDLFNIATLCG